MFTIPISRNKKRGMTTIIGTLIFISIIFTALVPLELSMLQTDTYETQIINDIEISEKEKNDEALTIIVFPETTTSNLIKIRVENTGVLDVTRYKVWIKNQQYLVNDTIPFDETTTIGPFTVETEPGTSYPVKVVTERGNVFGSVSGSLIFSSNGIWFTPSLGVNVYIANEKGKYFIEISNSTWCCNYTTLGEDFGDVVVLFDVETVGTYHVICKVNDATGPDLPGTPTDVVINWPNGSPIVFVYTSGLDI